MDTSTSGPQMQILLPKSFSTSVDIAACFLDDFDHLFEEHQSDNGSVAAERAGTSTDIENALSHQQAPKASNAVPQSLPNPNMLPRPEDLFPTLAPYYMIIEVKFDRMTIQGSHQPSLEVLAKYFLKHIRSTDNTRDKVGFPSPLLLLPCSFPLTVGLTKSSNHGSRLSAIHQTLVAECSPII